MGNLYVMKRTQRFARHEESVYVQTGGFAQG